MVLFRVCICACVVFVCVCMCVCVCVRVCVLFTHSTITFWLKIKSYLLGFCFVGLQNIVLFFSYGFFFLPQRLLKVLLSSMTVWNNLEVWGSNASVICGVRSFNQLMLCVL